ncbi:C40 family peptidase [Bacillus sp. MUM 13]|uniref:C40 family peptidase n=1 Tax=Bacillus sp. MUM 13 TaxID=1678001 RepID=UPI0008F59DF8|nr:C40 family peptidase [Bacillus sp. MUM 13]OIK06802.1 hypothetical protein BIV59_21265 [Bacillus sp. MUM 13]
MIGFINVPVCNLWSNWNSPMEEDYSSLTDNFRITEWYKQLPVHMKSTKARVRTQLLYGEPVLIDKRVGEWLYVAAKEQITSDGPMGYPGWLPITQVEINDKYNLMVKEKQMAMIISKTALFQKMDGSSLELSFMTKFPIYKEEAEFVWVCGPSLEKGKIKRSDVYIISKTEHLDFKTGLLPLLSNFSRTPFIGGGTSSFGFDCSGFVFRIYQALGIKVSRNVKDQLKEGHEISINEISPGDLLFYCTDPVDPQNVNHVGIYLGNGKFISARRTGLPIKISHVSEPFYAGKYHTARRYIL